MDLSALITVSFSNQHYGRLSLLLLLLGEVTNISADSQIDSHEVDYIPKLDPVPGLKQDQISLHVNSSSRSSQQEFPSYITEILNKDIKQTSSQQHKKHQNKHHHQYHYDHHKGNRNPQSSSEIQDQTYEYYYANKEESVVTNKGYDNNVNYGQRHLGEENHGASSSSSAAAESDISKQSGAGGPTTMKQISLYSDLFHSGQEDHSDQGVDSGNRLSYQYVSDGGHKFANVQNNIVYGGSWVYGMPLEEDEGHTEQPAESFSAEKINGPRFDRSLPRNVSVQAGKTAELACKVLDISAKSVSWMRHEDLHILSVGKYKYSTDQRLSVSHTDNDEGDEEWQLRIDNVTEQDAGMYECQVSTKPVLSFIVNLQVIVPKAEIVKGPEIFVHKGSLINLTCVVTHGTEKPVYVYWYHHNKVIDYEGRGGVTVITKASRDTVSYLLMRNANAKDSGIYACRPSNGEEATATLHVLSGEHQAAMQINDSSRLWTSSSRNILIVTSLLHLFYFLKGWTITITSSII